jgi:hypothetical protein
MVQVDVFWSYAIGAGFAVAATRHIARSAATSRSTADRWQRLNSPYWVATVLYCALLFAPSGVYLLWAFPDWETMQVAHNHASLPAWLVTIFAITNITQGMLGYWVAARLIRSGHRYAAFLQAGLGYFGMFFILVHGWDGRGYQRFFSADREVFQAWPRSPSIGEALDRIGRWFTSPVALTLAGMSVIVFVLLWMMCDWLRDGYRQDDVVGGPTAPVIVGVTLGSVFVVTLGSAIAASVLIHLLGWWIGVPAAMALIWFGVVWPRTGVAYRLFQFLQLADESSDLVQPVATRV